MPLIMTLGRRGLSYNFPGPMSRDLTTWSDADLALEFDQSRQAGRTEVHRKISAEIARRDPASRRATPRL